MAFHFRKKELDAIANVLKCDYTQEGPYYRFVLNNQKEGRRLSLEIYPDIAIGQGKGNLISVYTRSTHLQLHFCSGFVASDMLGEVTFIGQNAGRLSGLIIERGAACCLYANVDGRLLSGDFTKLGPEVMLSGIALSLAETILPEKKRK